MKNIVDVKELGVLTDRVNELKMKFDAADDNSRKAREELNAAQVSVGEYIGIYSKSLIR